MASPRERVAVWEKLVWIFTCVWRDLLQLWKFLGGNLKADVFAYEKLEIEFQNKGQKMYKIVGQFNDFYDSLEGRTLMILSVKIWWLNKI